MAVTNRVTSEHVGSDDPDAFNVVAYIKQVGGVRERYIFIYRDCEANQILRVAGMFAANSELSFAWWDAAVVAKRVREEAGKARG